MIEQKSPKLQESTLQNLNLDFLEIKECCDVQGEYKEHFFFQNWEAQSHFFLLLHFAPRNVGSSMSFPFLCTTSADVWEPSKAKLTGTHYVFELHAGTAPILFQSLV